MVKCSICGNEFENGYKLGAHKATKHSTRSATIKKRTQSHLKKFVKICLKCGKEFEVIRREKNDILIEPREEKKYCSRSCANGHPHTEKWKENISNGLKGKTSWYIDGRMAARKKCLVCGKEIRIRNMGYCSVCRHTLPVSSETKIKMSNAQFRLVKEGRHHGWSARNVESYPEKVFKYIFRERGLLEGRDYIFNFPVNQKELGLNSMHNYFLDFYFPNGNVDLEIDGNQHFTSEEAILHDVKRNLHLSQNGYNVYRIKWKDIRKESGKAYIRAEADKFFDYLNSLRK